MEIQALKGLFSSSKAAFHSAARKSWDSSEKSGSAAFPRCGSPPEKVLSHTKSTFMRIQSKLVWLLRLKTFLTALPVCVKRKRPAAEAGFFLPFFGTAEARALIRT